MDKSFLVDVGFTPREADAYIVLLQLQEAKASEISRLTNESRTHLYDTMASLMDKGMASYVIKENTKCFKPSPPEKIIDYLREREKTVEKHIGELNNLYKPRIKMPIVEVFEGKEGVKTVLGDLLRENKEWLCLGSTGRWKEIIPLFLDYLHKHRVKQKMQLRVIYNDDGFGRERGEKLSKQKYTHVRYMANTGPSTTHIYGDKVAILVWEKQKLLAIRIHDSSVAGSYRTYFESLWRVAKQ